MTSAAIGMSRRETSQFCRLRLRARHALDILASGLSISALTIILTVGGIAYGSALAGLPIFGDATIHARIARSLFHAGPFATHTDYPLFYHVAGGLALLAGGETGYRMLSVAALLLTVAGVFVLARELTASRLCAVTAACLAMFAPESIFYTGRMYMEVLLSGLVVWAVYFLARYLRSLRRADLLRCAALCGLAAATKQQGLVLLVPSTTIFLFVWLGWRWHNSQVPARAIATTTALFVLIACALAVPAYAPMLHSSGRVLPATGYTNWLNSSIAATTDQHPQQEAWSVRWGPVLDASFAEHDGARGFARAESRHVWPWQAWTTSRGLFGVQTLFWSGPPWRYPDWITLPLCALFLAGAGLWVWQWRRAPFFWFMALFLLINYAAFIRNNDQARYHLYLAYLLTFLIPFGLMGWRRVHPLLAPLAIAMTLALVTIFAVAAMNYFPPRLQRLDAMAGQQAYAPSVGGNASVREVGAWLKATTAPDQRFYAVPANEFSYYAQRDGVFDYRIYFLPSAELSDVIRDMGVRYIVIADSAVQQDAAWNNVVKMPTSFAARISRLYPAVYASSARDIVVYDATANPNPSSNRDWNIQWIHDGVPSILPVNQRSETDVSVANDGALVWPRVITRVSYHWYAGTCPGDPSDPRSLWDGLRTSLPRNVAPGDSVNDLRVKLQAPARPGIYCLALDLVAEHFGWASRLGASPDTQTVLVQ